MTDTSSTERAAGLALIGAGVLSVVVNSVLTPLLPRGTSFAQTAASWVFAWRQGAASVCALLLLFGTVGLHLRLSERAGKPGAVAFGLAFCGSALLLGVEWAQLFDIRDFARGALDTLNALNATRGPSLSDIGGLIVLSIFSMVIGGFFLIPILQPPFPGLLGAIVGNVVLGVDEHGWA